MTANKNAKASHRAGGNKAPRDIPDRAQLRSHKAALERRSEHQPPPRKVGSSATDPQQGPLQRCQSASPPPISSPVKGPAHPLSDSDEPCRKGRYAKASDSKLLSLKNWSNRASTLRSGSTLPSDIDSQNRLLKSVSIGCLDTKLSLYKPLGGGKDQKENHQEGPASDGVSSNQLGWSTLCLGPASNHRSLSLSRSSVCSQSLGIRKKISEWECRKATPARMSLCLDKRPLGDRVGNEFLSNCYGTDKVRKKSFTIGSPDDAGSVCNSKRGSFSSVVTEPDSTPGTDKVSKMKQRFSVSSESSYCPELLPENPDNTSVNPVPKPKRTFEYEADSNHKSMPSNGLSPTPASASPPPLPSTPAPPVTRRQKKESIFHRKVQNRKSFEFEDAASLQSSHTPSPTKNGTASPETRSQFSSKSTLEENAYEDIVESPKENPYEDVDLKGRSLGRKSKLSSENSLHRMWTPQDRKYTTPPQAERGQPEHHQRALHTQAQEGPQDENSESESDSDDRFKAHTQRLLHLQSMLRRAPSYRTLELELIQWQERELFEYFVVVSLKKKPSKNSYIPDVTYQFPKPSGKGPRLPEVYCVISRLGCFDLFSKILDEVERRREVSAALVYPFMRSLMESPFPAPGKTIKVKTFLPGAGNEVIELRRPMDSRLEHVDFDSLFRCLSVRQVIRVFASLLLERRVIFVADKLSILSSCVHAVVALLYPFSWQHTFIPVLPSSIVDIVCCPTPFLVGLLSSSLPKLKELPVEEMDDEDTLLPRKLQAALEQALVQKNDLMNQDSDSESDEESNSLSSLVSEAFIRFFLETIGHYTLFLTQNEKGERVFQREAFRKSVASKSIRRFLGVFMESQMFAGFIQDREMRKCRAKGLFEQRVEQYLEELPDTEQSGVNKFLKGLGQLTTDTAHQGFPDNVNIQRPQPLICQGLPATLHHRPVDQANEFQPCFQQLTPVYCGQCHHRPQALQEHLAQQCMHLTETNRGHTRLLQHNPMGQHELEQGRRYRRTMPYPMKTTQPWKVPQQAQLEQDQQAGMGAHLQMKQLEQNAYPVSCMLPSHSIHQQMHLHRAPPRMKAPQTHMAQQQPVVQRSHLQQMQLLQQRQMQKTEPLLPDHAMQHGVLQPSQLEQMQKVPKVLLQTQEPKLQLQPPAKPQQFQQARVGQINYIVRQQPVQPQNGVQQQSFQPAQDNGRVQQTEQLQQEAELQQHNENHGMTHASVVNQIAALFDDTVHPPQTNHLQSQDDPNHKPLDSSDLHRLAQSCDPKDPEPALLSGDKEEPPCTNPPEMEEASVIDSAIENEDFCAVCLNGGDLLCCDRCPKVFHLPCHVPSLLSFPVGEWVCSLCRNLQIPEMKYDCENTRLIQEHKGKRPQYGLSLYDQRARHYYQIIKKPIDLSVIRSKLNKRSPLCYYTPEEFVADVFLMFRNCAKFNYPDSEVAQAGSSLEAFFNEKLKEVFPDKAFRDLTDDSDPEEFDGVYKSTESRCILEEPVEWADGFIVVYNISDRASFLNAKNIVRQIKEARIENCKGEVEVPICLVGNKQDLCHARQVCEEEAHSLALENKCHFQEVSAAEHYQEILTMFIKLIRNVMDHLKYRADRRRYSGSKSMAKLINNVFGKRRKSV
ncbi:UNVERIFIED_CONTAM: hypothetical protein FKN15_055392 [Acipenser sinensis]